MRDENNTPIDMPAEIEMSPEQPFFDAIHENIDVTRVSPGKLRAAAKACLALADTMVDASKAEMRKAFQDEAAGVANEISALTNMVRDRDTEIAELKARITEMEAEANEGRRIRKDLGKELSEIRAAHARLIDENAKLWKDNAELHENNKGLKETRYRLATIIDDLANVIRNS